MIGSMILERLRAAEQFYFRKLRISGFDHFVVEDRLGAMVAAFFTINRCGLRPSQRSGNIAAL
jgi:hypothetical protein